MADDLSGEVAFQTNRLLVRRWTAGDLPDLLHVYGDAEAMRWVNDGQPMSEVQGLQWLGAATAVFSWRSPSGHDL